MFSTENVETGNLTPIFEVTIQNDANADDKPVQR
jgi:hypothetical protein